MSSKIFQNVIIQMKDAVDRVIGVVDEQGFVVASSELAMIGSRLDDFRAYDFDGGERYVVTAARTYSPLSAEGVKLEKVASTVDLAWLTLSQSQQRAWGSPSLGLKHAMMLAIGAKYRRMRSSMLAAIERGREPPVDYLNGEVVRRGQAHGIAVPVNEHLQRAVHAMTRRELSPGLEALRRIHEQTRPQGH